jgi:hypothetical protein
MKHSVWLSPNSQSYILNSSCKNLWTRIKGKVVPVLDNYHTMKTWHDQLYAFLICIQVPVLSALFFVLFLGNTVTTSMVIPQKLQEQVGFKYQLVGLERLSWGGTKQHNTRHKQPNSIQVSTTLNIFSLLFLFYMGRQAYGVMFMCLSLPLTFGSVDR